MKDYSHRNDSSLLAYIRGTRARRWERVYRLRELFRSRETAWSPMRLLLNSTSFVPRVLSRDDYYRRYDVARQTRYGNKCSLSLRRNVCDDTQRYYARYYRGAFQRSRQHARSISARRHPLTRPRDPISSRDSKQRVLS